MDTTSINISPKNVSGKCDLKCAFNFKYSESVLVVTNNGVQLSLEYEATAPPVVYNEQKYSITNIILVSPSIHNFNGNKMPAELIAYHSPVVGGNTLAVCVPFSKSSETSSATELITSLIEKCATSAPSEGDSTTANIPGFSLQQIIPKSAFFTYTNETTDWIVYGVRDAIPLSETTLTTLSQIIQPFSLDTPGEKLFYNPKGPSTGIPIGDGLYISCQPTGSSTEEIAVTYDKPSTSYDFAGMFKGDTSQSVIGAIVIIVLFLALFYGLSVFFHYLNNSDKVGGTSASVSGEV